MVGHIRAQGWRLMAGRCSIPREKVDGFQLRPMIEMNQPAPQIVTPVQSPDLELTLSRNSWYSPLSFETASWLIKHFPRPFTRSMSLAAGELGYRLCKDRREALQRNLN